MWVGFWDFGEYWRWYEVGLDVASFRVDKAVRPYAVKCWAEYWGLVLDGVPAEVRRGEDPAPCRLFDRVARLVDRAVRECRLLYTECTGAEVEGDGGDMVPGTYTAYSIYGCRHVAAQLWRLATERMARGDLATVKVDALLRVEPCVGSLEEVLRCVAERFGRFGVSVGLEALGGDWRPASSGDEAVYMWAVEGGGRRHALSLLRLGGGRLRVDGIAYTREPEG